MCTVIECSKPSPHGYLCADCLVQVSADVEHLEWIWEQLELTRTRQGNTAKDRVRCASGGTQPLPWVAQAADAATSLAAVVMTTAHALWSFTATTPPLACDPLRERDPVRPVIGWIRENYPAFTRCAQAGQLLAAIDSATERAMTVIDHPADRVFLGRCDRLVDRAGRRCTAELLAEVDEPTVVCWSCRHAHDVSELQDDLMYRARDYVTHSGRLASLLTLMGIPIAASTIRGYASKRGLKTISTDRLGRPCYRVGDVMNMRMTSFARERARAGVAS
jgi:hypothetical protein